MAKIGSKSDNMKTYRGEKRSLQRMALFREYVKRFGFYTFIRAEDLLNFAKKIFFIQNEQLPLVAFYFKGIL